MTQVAKRGTGQSLQWLSWKELPQLHWYKKLYDSKPELFLEKDGVVYMKREIKKTSEEIRLLLNSCLKIAGSPYALALELCNGNRKSAAFQETLNLLNQRVFRDKHLWDETFKNYIKEHGIKVALINNGMTHWIELDDDFHIKPCTLRSYLVTHPEKFERVGEVLFLLPTQNILLENMFFKCVELAGSEHALASDLCVDNLTKERHLKNFERMTFKHDANFKTYSKLFSNYLERNQTLFEEEVIYA